MGCCATKDDKKKKKKAENEEEEAEFPEQESALSKRLAEIFRKYDIDGDGCLDR